MTDPSSPVAIATERLLLRHFETSDWPGLHALQSDPDTCRYLTSEPYSEQAARDYIAADVALRAESPRQVFEFAVTLKDGGALVGRCGLRIHDPELGDAAVWYVLHPRRRGAGLMAEAVNGLFGHAFGPLGLHRLWADIDPRNAPSARLAEALDMRLEAHFLENVMIKGELCGTLIYAMLRREWEARR